MHARKDNASAPLAAEGGVVEEIVSTICGSPTFRSDVCARRARDISTARVVQELVTSVSPLWRSISAMRQSVYPRRGIPLLRDDAEAAAVSVLREPDVGSTRLDHGAGWLMLSGFGSGSWGRGAPPHR